MKSRIDYFLLVKNVTKKCEENRNLSIHCTRPQRISISLSWSCESPRGPGVWKFNDILFQDEESVEWVRDTYSNT